MTSAPKTRPTSPPKRHRQHDPEERFQMWVTIGFIALITAVVIAIVVGIGYSFWQQHWQSVASVGGTGITKDQWADRGKLELFRLDQQEGRIRTALAAGQLSSTDADTLLSDIATAKSNVATTAIDDLIDLTYQGQLATKQGIPPATDADVDTAVTADATTPEQRAVDVIFVAPTASDPSAGPTTADKQNAYTAIHAAADALAAGTAFETVAAQYSTDASKDKGGSYGVVTKASSLDPTFLQALFALPEGGSTGIITGADGTYRIGKVGDHHPRHARHQLPERGAAQPAVGHLPLQRAHGGLRAEAQGQHRGCRVRTDGPGPRRRDLPGRRSHCRPAPPTAARSRPATSCTHPRTTPAAPRRWRRRPRLGGRGSRGAPGRLAAAGGDRHRQPHQGLRGPRQAGERRHRQRRQRR